MQVENTLYVNWQFICAESIESVLCVFISTKNNDLSMQMNAKLKHKKLLVIWRHYTAKIYKAYQWKHFLNKYSQMNAILYLNKNYGKQQYRLPK